MATQRIHSGTLGNPQVGSFRATPRDSNAILTIRRHIGYFRNFLNFVHHGFAPGQHATAVGKALQTVISSGDYRNPDHSRFFEENVSEYFLAPLLLQYFDSYRKTSFGDQGIDRRSLYAHSAVYQTLVQVKLYRNKIGHDEITKFLGAIDLFERTNLRRPRTYGVFITLRAAFLRRLVSWSAPIEIPEPSELCFLSIDRNLSNTYLNIRNFTKRFSEKLSNSRKMNLRKIDRIPSTHLRNCTTLSSESTSLY